MSADSSNPVAVRRLIVDLNEPSDIALTESCYRSGLSRSYVVNRALQVYEHLAANQVAGGSLLITRPDGTTEKLVLT